MFPHSTTHEVCRSCRNSGQRQPRPRAPQSTERCGTRGREGEFQNFQPNVHAAQRQPGRKSRMKVHPENHQNRQPPQRRPTLAASL
jgi:hypothetical protein